MSDNHRDQGGTPFQSTHGGRPDNGSPIVIGTPNGTRPGVLVGGEAVPLGNPNSNNSGRK